MSLAKFISRLIIIKYIVNYIIIKLPGSGVVVSGGSVSTFADVLSRNTTTIIRRNRKVHMGL